MQSLDTDMRGVFFFLITLVAYICSIASVYLRLGAGYEGGWYFGGPLKCFTDGGLSLSIVVEPEIRKKTFYISYTCKQPEGYGKLTKRIFPKFQNKSSIVLSPFVKSISSEGSS